MARTNEDDVRTALIGFGLAGAVFHAPLIATTPGLRLTTVITSNPGRRAQAEREYPWVRVLDRAERLWDFADQHDLVVIATPNRFHVPLALAAIEARLAVVVDKPFASTASEARRVMEEATERGVVLSVFQNRRWDGDFLTVDRLLSEGALGAISRFESRFERWRPEVDRSNWREWGASEEGGGLLLDLGSHLVDQAIRLFGPPTRVYAEVDRRRPGADADDDVFVALTHAGGVRSHLWASHLAGILGPRFRVLGTRGSFEKRGLDVQEEALAAGALPGGEAWGQEAPDDWGILSIDGEVRSVPTEPGAYERFYEGVVDSIRSGAPPPVDPGDAVRALEILDLARRSAESAVVVTL